MTLTFHCNYCPETFPNFKTLLTHYTECHKEQRKRYEVRHKNKGGRGIVDATSEEEASRFFGWQVDECKVTQLDNLEEV